MLSTFNHYSLKKLQALGAPSQLGMLYTDPLYKPWRYAAKLGVGAIHPPARYVLTAGWVRKTHAAGLAVRPWVVNSERLLARMFSWGVDAVCTDAPAAALAARVTIGPRALSVAQALLGPNRPLVIRRRAALIVSPAAVATHHLRRANSRKAITSGPSAARPTLARTGRRRLPC